MRRMWKRTYSKRQYDGRKAVLVGGSGVVKVIASPRRLASSSAHAFSSSFHCMNNACIPFMRTRELTWLLHLLLPFLQERPIQTRESCTKNGEFRPFIWRKTVFYAWKKFNLHYNHKWMVGFFWVIFNRFFFPEKNVFLSIFFVTGEKSKIKVNMQVFLYKK